MKICRPPNPPRTIISEERIGGFSAGSGGFRGWLMGEIVTNLFFGANLSVVREGWSACFYREHRTALCRIRTPCGVSTASVEYTTRGRLLEGMERLRLTLMRFVRHLILATCGKLRSSLWLLQVRWVFLAFFVAPSRMFEYVILCWRALECIISSLLPSQIWLIVRRCAYTGVHSGGWTLPGQNRSQIENCRFRYETRFKLMKCFRMR